MDDQQPKKVSDMSLSEVNDHLQILEYVELNKPREFTQADRRFREELEARERQLHDQREHALRPANDNATDISGDRPQDIELQERLHLLDLRHEKELKDIRTRHFRELANPAADENITERHTQEYDDARARHDEEKQRATEEYSEAKKIFAEMQADERARHGPIEDFHDKVETQIKHGESTMSSGAEFDAKIPFTQDPEFIEREQALILGHEKERNKLLEQQDRARIEFTKKDPTREMLDDQNKRQRDELKQLDRKHKEQHEAYIRQYHDAKVIEAELREQARQRERGMDGPKISR